MKKEDGRRKKEEGGRRKKEGGGEEEEKEEEEEEEETAVHVWLTTRTGSSEKISKVTPAPRALPTLGLRLTFFRNSFPKGREEVPDFSLPPSFVVSLAVADSA
jgi:hypothetical protein